MDARISMTLMARARLATVMRKAKWAPIHSLKVEGQFLIDRVAAGSDAWTIFFFSYSPTGAAGVGAELINDSSSTTGRTGLQEKEPQVKHNV